MTSFKINGSDVSVDVADDTPLLWVIREQLGLTGTKFGCGIAQCGACTVHIDGVASRSCVTPVFAVEGSDVTTIEGLSENGDHPLQTAWVEVQAPQCGYCQSGQIMQAADLLQNTPNPTDDEITSAMTGNLCRCMAYIRIKKAIRLAADQQNGGATNG